MIRKAILYVVDISIIRTYVLIRLKNIKNKEVKVMFDKNFVMNHLDTATMETMDFMAEELEKMFDEDEMVTAALNGEWDD